ncbi:RpiB/LacA/LacB family sugar-phosphate isomerase [Rhodobium gokarnense]|uniref:Ribose 5-phosphate isomerase RpiB n=1 Tax=Rhodobium gokarnense TaxID=364296 RepID=A0ABT3HDI0_9HYPH|nr:RpiB/LacA/LacB family sugar-phosphate isomerase [Rhodobium gokarnense]MCW2308435.1 ribose 5-phosphate isomerase RpiB [Rhodobium gokarnense]
MAIAFGCSRAGTALNEKFGPYLAKNGNEVDDFGPFDDTPVLSADTAHALSKPIAAGRNEASRI